MNIDLEQNKKTVVAFYDLMFNQCKPAEAIELHAGDVYRQHNPEVADGKQAFIEYFKRMADDVLQVIPETSKNDSSMF